ncbi:4-alpha-glucanotransferase [Prochlorococcus marinus]|uniref:4-alpha-glucanotransferase n=1 Tax=Prochlorococcus marinus TaxID=1219 RepID=UPI001ADB728D|nr:4-alpha-glucanotransferase [Prochlorococcus marinus]MBO8217445.1 4-alpha-glucanotransferase [Prochlorococcus marinus XMU1405]MBW3040660.1 4-alpha-glucanotransferase [Prochlorococcus marinus str. MU1405]MBW3048117.1 4-alpha-glucanotransferase [Prochlorococcus marinus str. MU1406]
MSMKTVLKKKSLGILMHPSCLPGGKVCGTFGRGAKDWIKKLHCHGIEYWQFLPLTPTDSTGSPYSSPSSFALNPWFLDVDYLIEEGFIFISNLEELGPTNNQNTHFDFDDANNLTKKLGHLLLQGWSSQSKERKLNFNEWIRKNSWVEDYATFDVIREEFNMLPWWQWPKEFKIKNNEFLKTWTDTKSEKILIKKLIQWHLDEQWTAIKKFAKSYSVKLIGDLPFYVSRDSADVWSNKSLFSIFKNGDLIFQSGVPPDYFSSTGQLWGTPTYFWSKHKSTNFNWWRKRFKRQFELMDLMRLDHFRGLAGYWRVNGNAKTAISGKWINSPGRTLLNKLKIDLGTDLLPIIAEDLGVITPDVEKLRKNFKLPGMKILQFAFDGNEDNPYLPKNIEGENWVVYTGTHDNSTSVSWWECLENNSKELIKDQFKLSDNPSWSLIKIGMDTNANLFIAPIQDILSLDDSSRLNIPGTTKNNWKWKLNRSLGEVEDNIRRFSELGNNFGRTRK